MAGSRARSPDSNSRRAVRIAHWTGIGWWLMPVLYAVLLAAPSATLPGDGLGIRVFQTPALSPSLRLGQTFTMPGDGFHAIEIFPSAVGGTVSGKVQLELHELDSGHREIALVRTAEASASDVVGAPSYRFEFAPIVDSKDRAYRFDLIASEAEGVAFWATKGNRYAGGAMHANGRGRWADLAFRVYAPNPSVWGRLMMLRDTNPVRAYLVIAAGLAVWLLLGFFLRAIEAIPAS